MIAIRFKNYIKNMVTLFLFYIVYFIFGGIITYIKQPKISEEYKNQFDVDDFYSDDISVDRATILEDNEQALKEKIRMIANAKKSIIMSTFSFKSDKSGLDIMAALLDASRRGVKISVLIDGYSSMLYMNNDPYFKALSSEANVTIKIYNKINIFIPWKIMGRMHDKYLIADNNVYILGGRNVHDKSLSNNGINHDRDILVYNTEASTKSSSLYVLLDYFNNIWDLDVNSEYYTSKKVKKASKVEAAKIQLKNIYDDMLKEHPEYFSGCDYIEITHPTKSIKLLSNPTGIYPKEPRVFYGLSQLMKKGQKTVNIHTPYVICNDLMYDSFSDIAKKNIHFKLMTNSVANNSNVFGSNDYRKNKGKILDTGVELYEYEGGTSYHGKTITIDDDISIVGSFNMDLRSVYIDTELMLVIDSKGLNSQLREYMESYEVDSRLVIDENKYITPEGLEVQKLTLEKGLKILVVNIFLGWTRFLM